MKFETLNKLIKPLVGSGIGRLPFVNTIYQKLIISTLPREMQVIEVQGFKIRILTDGYVNDIATELLFKKVHEPTTTRVFKALINEGDTVIDIGANVGYFTCLSAKLVGELGSVVAYEPGKDNIYELVQNVKLNRFKNVEIINKALSDYSGDADFWISTKECARHSLIQTNEHNAKTVVAVDKLDNHVKYRKVDFIKTDTEGNELPVLIGATKTILNNDNVKLILEVCEPALKACGNSLSELFSYLQVVLGFNSFYMIDDYKDAIKEIRNWQEIKHRKLACNLLCSKSKLATNGWL
jgi:FkbM family methyltransferase